jgi:hypothetical protein
MRNVSNSLSVARRKLLVFSGSLPYELLQLTFHSTGFSAKHTICFVSPIELRQTGTSSRVANRGNCRVVMFCDREVTIVTAQLSIFDAVHLPLLPGLTSSTRCFTVPKFRTLTVPCCSGHGLRIPVLDSMTRFVTATDKIPVHSFAHTPFGMAQRKRIRAAPGECICKTSIAPGNLRDHFIRSPRKSWNGNCIPKARRRELGPLCCAAPTSLGKQQ